MTSATPSSRTPQEYAQMVHGAREAAKGGQRLDIPPPLSMAEYRVLLDLALQELDKLNDVISKAFPEMEGEPATDVSSLSVDEKIAMGESNCRKLADLALQIAPLPTLERLDQQSLADPRVRAEAESLLSSLRKQS